MILDWTKYIFDFFMSCNIDGKFTIKYPGVKSIICGEAGQQSKLVNIHAYM